MNDNIKELALKIKALADNGVDGEKHNADAIMRNS